jgi:hypothetical protein
MPQIFHRSTNTLSRLSIFGALFVVGGVLWGLMLVNRSAYVSGVDVAVVQPIQFSHKHHAGELGIDCRYCHTAVEVGPVANIPPTRTCINCHAQIWADSPFLEPVRESLRTDRSIRWIRVHDLPDFVYFNHSIHVRKGIGCVSCHGRVDQMNQVAQAAPLQMEWCLDCHRHPERRIRPREHVFDLAWRPEDDPVDPRTQEQIGPELVRKYNVRTRTDCSTCHR